MLNRLGSISGQTVGGALSTGFHGTGLNYAIFSNYISELEILMANGDIKVFNSNSDEFQAFLCSLGCLGILLNVTIQCEPAFKLEQIETSAKLEDVIF